MRERKKMPHGIWFFFNVDDRTTEEQIVENFNRVGIPLTLDRVCVFDSGRACDSGFMRAHISINENVVYSLLQPLLDPIRMNGKAIHLTVPSSKFR